MADPEETIHVANDLRPYVPLLIALSANSPLWRGEPTGLASSRVPIFRAFPRVGLPPRFDGWSDFEARVQTLVDGGVIEDYTYLWYDVRPHPRLGTIEIRAMDSQTRVEHTLALAALVVSLVKLLTEQAQAGDGDRRRAVGADRREPLARGPPRSRGRAARPASGGRRPRARADRGAAGASFAPTPRELGCERAARRASTTCCAPATARSASRWSSRPTATCAS